MAGMVAEQPETSNLLSQRPRGSQVGRELPPVKLKLGALLLLPSTAPNQNVLATVILAANPPVPVAVKPVAQGMFSAIPAVVDAKVIVPDPKLIALVLTTLELNLPVVKLKLFKLRLPLVNAVLAVTGVANAPANVVVPV